MTAKEAKEKSNKAYFEMQEKKLNNKIKSVNNAIEEIILKGHYDTMVLWFDLDFDSYLKFRKYYKNLGYKVSFPQKRGVSGYYVTISWR